MTGDRMIDFAPTADGGAAIPLESVNIRSALPLGWQQIRELVKIANAFKQEPIQGNELELLRPPQVAFPVLHSIASAVVNCEDPQFPIVEAKPYEIQQAKPWVRLLSKAVQRISMPLGERIDGVAKRLGNETIKKYGQRIYETLHIIEHVDNPKDEFIAEIRTLYDRLAKRGEKFSREDHLRLVMSNIFSIAKGGPEEAPYFVKDFPLLSVISPVIAPILQKYEEDLPSALPELLQSMAVFLQTKGISVKPVVHDSLEHFFAEILAPEQLDQVKEKLPNLLTLACDALPSSGRDFAQAAYAIMKNVVSLHRQGHSGREIIGAMFGTSAI